jgi:hypothetical protein
MGRKARGECFPERLVRQGLISLTVAARMVHRRAYPQQYAIAEPPLSERQLESLAHVIASLAPIYTVCYRSARYRQIEETELRAAVFRDGAREISFADGRPPIGFLAARVESTSHVARKLRGITNANGAGAPTRKDRSPPTPTR